MNKSNVKKQREKLQAHLRQIRLDAGLRQVDLAKRLGQPQSYVSKYESGQRRLDLIEIRQVCVAIGTSLQDIVDTFEDSIK
ncbi:MAG: helix-turn-helix transcriptional regulator [Chloroflexi bacterium]|nr:helix-turn-helix transcriptional regulator [Chloroflexota bacterium]